VASLNDLISGPFGWFFLGPWYDPLAHGAIVRLYLPMSRAWAEASMNSGTVAAGLKEKYVEADRRFTDAAFSEVGDLARSMAARAHAADVWMRARAQHWRAGARRTHPPVRLQLETTADVAARHGSRRENPDRAFLPTPVPIVRSRDLTLNHRSLSWLRYASAAADGGEAWARVDSPLNGRCDGTVVFLHGILMEREFFSGLYDYAPPFLSGANGAMRLIQPEGPWHGRRMRPGWYGGEPLLGNPVGGLLDYFGAHVIEIGRLIAWARRSYGGPVAIAGVSLGALTTQLLISVARTWPAEARPDAALLITTNGSMTEVAFEGSLARSLEFPAHLHTAGWDEAALEQYRPLLEPGELALSPESVMAVLGATDTVTPINGGERLVARWTLPSANVFRRSGGHFSAAFSLLRDFEPIERLKQAMQRPA